MNTLGRICIAGLGLSVLAGGIWGCVIIAATHTIKGNPGLAESVGLTGLVVTFVAAGIALVNGLILGAISSGRQLPRRILWHVAAYLTCALAWAIYSVRIGPASDLKSLVSARNYADFEKKIPADLNEAWAAALIHADPAAMKLCIKHGAGAGTWARVDTSLFASRPDESPIELIISHRYWSSLIPEQQNTARESLRLLSEHGADLDSRCVEGGTRTPLEYATERNLPVLKSALEQLGATP